MLDKPDLDKIAKHSWGQEITWVDNERYTGKLVTLWSSCVLDRWVWNSKRDRAVLVLKGMMRVELSDGTDAVHRVLLPGQGYRLEAGVPHRIVAQGDLDFVEVSVPHEEAGVLSPGDVVSLFGRRRDTEDVRH